MSICTSPQTHVEGIPNTISCILHNNNHFSTSPWPLAEYYCIVYVHMYICIYIAIGLVLYVYMIALYV